jgi:hypothetical protein
MSSGSLPDAVITKARDKYLKDIESAEGDKKDKKLRKEFLLINSYETEKLLLNGLVLYNDPIGLYVNKVKDKLLEKDASLKESLNVYVLRSSSVNAFADNNGLIFITMGMLARLKTEAELAFVLSHEITHYTSKHVINGYVEVKKSERKYDEDEKDDFLLERSLYSKEKELEADAEGLELYLKTSYNRNAPLNVMTNTLKYSSLPVYQTPFTADAFSIAGLSIPPDYFSEKVLELTGEDDYEDDMTSSHPNLGTRKDKLTELLEKATDGKADFLVSQQEFNKIVKMANYEICKIYLRNLQFERAIYQAFALLKENPESIYLKKIIGRGLYGLTMFSNRGKMSKVHVSPQKFPGEAYRVSYLIDNLEKSELNLLALNYNWKLYMENPADSELAKVSDLLLVDLIKYNNKRENYYYKSAKDTSSSKNGGSATFSEADQEYIDEKKQKENGVVGNPRFPRTSLIGLFKDKSFSRKFSEYEKTIGKAKNKNGSRSVFREIESTEKQNADLAKKTFKKNQKILYVNPIYLRIDIRKDVDVRYKASERNKKIFNDNLLKFSKRLRIKSEILDKDVIRQDSDMERYNDMSTAQGWIDEMYRNKGVPMLPVYYDQMMEVTRKYDTDQIAVVGTVSVVEPTTRKAGKIITGIVLPAYLPIAIYKVANPTYQTVIFGNIFSVSKGISVKREESYLDYKDRTDILATGLYDILLKIKNHKDENTSK